MAAEQKEGSGRERARRLRESLIAEHKEMLKRLGRKANDVATIERYIPSAAEQNQLHEIAIKLARKHGVPIEDDRIIEIMKLLGKQNPRLEEVESLWNPVRLFWSVGLSVEPTGQVKSEFPANLPKFCEFIKPNRIYLDVTDATKKDILAKLGPRIARSQARINIPLLARKRAKELLQLLKGQDLRIPRQQLRGQELSKRVAAEQLYIKPFKVPAPRGRSTYTENELVGHFEEYYKRLLKTKPPSNFELHFEVPTNVVAWQDLMISVGMKPPHRRPGRTKGESRKPKKWLADMTVPELLDYLRIHPEECSQKRDEYVAQRVNEEREKRRQSYREGKANNKPVHPFLEVSDPLTKGDIRSIKSRARKNFDNRIKVPLQRERTK